MRRVVLVLADGLRPDAITPGIMPSLDALGSAFTIALHARTVRPSTTVAALASLAVVDARRRPVLLNMPNVLFLCVANSARSQMAEGLARAMAPAGFQFHSAGSEPGTLHPLAVAALAEEGIDTSHHRAKGLSDVPLPEMDVIVTLCAEEVCPIVPGAVRRLHWALPDPARATGPEAERLAAFRATRDRLKQLLPQLW